MKRGRWSTESGAIGIWWLNGTPNQGCLKFFWGTNSSNRSLVLNQPPWCAKKQNKFVCSRFSLYKLPKHVKGEIPMLGLEYMYMDTLAPQWQLSKYLINMTQGALGQTLKQLYDTYESEASDISLSFW
ncbi:hypothetical protein Q9966_003998 [Columba livia]|nr:hypothetical protein Q9966_003998 [Columba livia]